MIEQRLTELINHRNAFGYNSENVLDKALTLDFARKTLEVIGFLDYAHTRFFCSVSQSHASTWRFSRMMSQCLYIKWKGVT